jgi:hypothetical protein
MLRIGRASPLATALSLTMSAHGASPVHPANSASAADSATVASDVGVFARYAGTWQMQLAKVQTPYSKASSETMTVKNDCWRSEIFYVCDQIINGAPTALIVFFYNADEKTFGSFPITARSDVVHPGSVVVDGKTVTFPWQINDNGKTISMRIVNTFTTADTMEFRQDYSEDGQTWVAMATGTEHKVDTKGSAKSK